MKVIALDPGGTTGWAMYSNGRYTCGQLGPEPHHYRLYISLCEEFEFGVLPSEGHLVTESFEYRNRSRPGLELVSKEYIGIARLFCQMSGMLLFEQTASMGKGFVKDDNIKRLGLWVPAKKHAMDAYRHLLYFMVHTLGDSSVKKELLVKGWK